MIRVLHTTLLIAERTFRGLDAPERLAEVANGVSYTNGVRQREKKVAALSRLHTSRQDLGGAQRCRLGVLGTWYRSRRW